MDAPSTFSMFGGNETTMLSILVFLATGTLAFAVMIGVRAREAVRRRAVRVGIDDEENAGRRSLRYSGVSAAHKLIDYATKHYSAADNKDLKMLQNRLIQAGIYNPRAAAYFFFARHGARVGPGGRDVLCGADVPSQRHSRRFGCWCWRVACADIWRRRSISTRSSRKSVRSIVPDFPTSWTSWSCVPTRAWRLRPSLDRIGRELGEFLPVALCQHPYGQSRNSRWPHRDRGARTPRRPSRPGRGAVLCHAHSTIGRTRFQHQRRIAGLLRRHAAQAIVARRGKGLRPAGQACRCR